MKIKKRNGMVVPYDGEKITRAIVKAMNDVGIADEKLAESMQQNIYDFCTEREMEIVLVEQIQDLVSFQLLTNGLKKVQENYSFWRNIRNVKRATGKQDPIRMLSKDFLSKYKHKPEPFPTVMSLFTYLRTYSRFLPEEGRRERWWETVRRVVEYNTSLAPTSISEAEEFYDNIYNLRQFPSGRTLWVADTKVSTEYPMSNYNCAFCIPDDYETIAEIFYLLLVGAGVGIRVLPEDIANLPKLRTNIELDHVVYKEIKKDLRLESTELHFKNKGEVAEIVIGDSKEGWMQALEMFFKLMYNSTYKKVRTIKINYNNIRPAGEPLATFGGYASGHLSMLNMFEKLFSTIKNNSRPGELALKVTPIVMMDFVNIVGENVVSGGVRRTAEIILFDAKDEEIKNAKSNLYEQKNGKWTINQDIVHRQMSNNSVFYKEKPSLETIKWQLETMRYSGEPKLIWAR